MRGDRLSVPAPRTSLSLKHAHACRHADYAAWGPADVACQDMPSHDAHIYVAKPSAGSTCVRHNERLPVRSKNRSLKGRSAGCEGLHSEYRQGTVPSMRHATPRGLSSIISGQNWQRCGAAQSYADSKARAAEKVCGVRPQEQSLRFFCFADRIISSGGDRARKRRLRGLVDLAGGRGGSGVGGERKPGLPCRSLVGVPKAHMTIHTRLDGTHAHGAMALAACMFCDVRGRDTASRGLRT